MIKKILLFLLVITSAGVSFGIDYYVSPNGNNGNPGTFNKPWKTAKYAVERLTAGDNLYFRGGKYPVESQITIRNSGWKKNWVKIMAYENEIPVLDAAGAPINASGAILSAHDKNYIRVEGLHIQNSFGGGFLFTICDSVELINNVVYRTFNSGIRFYGDHIKYIFCNDIKIIGNYVLKPNCYELKQPDDDRTKSPHEGITIGRVNGFECAYNELCYGDKEGIDCKGPTRNGTIHHNHVHHQQHRPWSVAIYCDAWTHDSLMNIEIYDNLLHDCDDGVQIQSEDGRDVVNLQIHNNLVYNMGWSGIGASNNSPWKDGPKQDGITQNIWFWNNTVHNANDAVWLHGEIQNIYFINNIISSSKRRNIDNRDSIDFKEKNIVFEKNLFYRGYTDTTLAEMGIPDNLTGDPKFKRLSVSDFHLNDGSPAINAGTTAYEFNTESDTDLGFAPANAAYITTSADHLLVDYADLQAFVGFTASMENPEFISDSDWLSVSLWNDRLMLMFSPNRTAQRRKGTITISGDSVEKEIIVFQKAGKTATGVYDLIEERVKIYPTVTNDGIIYISHDLNPDHATITIFNLNGMQVHNKKCTSRLERVVFSDSTAPGVYIAEIKDNKSKYQQKIIINKK